MNRKVTRNVPRKANSKTRARTTKTSGSAHPLSLTLAQHRFHFSDTLKRLLKEPAASLMTVCVIAIALALPACLYLMVANAQALTARWQTTHDISVYIDGSVSLNKLSDLKQSITQRPDVQLVRIISSEEALNSLKQETQLDMISEAIGENPLPHTLIVSPIDNVIAASSDKSITTLIKALEQIQAVSDVQLDAEWVMKLRNLISLLKRGVWLLASLLALGVLLAVSNTIRLHVQQRQHEIEVKKLIGATDDFVRRPFLYLGFWYGFLGAMLASCLVSILLLALTGPAARLSKLYASSFQLQGLGFSNSLFLVILGTFLALFGAWFAAERTLKKIEVH